MNEKLSCAICYESNKNWCEMTPVGRVQFNDDDGLSSIILPTTIDECMIRKIFIKDDNPIKYI